MVAMELLSHVTKVIDMSKRRLTIVRTIQALYIKKCLSLRLHKDKVLYVHSVFIFPHGCCLETCDNWLLVLPLLGFYLKMTFLSWQMKLSPILKI